MNIKHFKTLIILSCLTSHWVINPALANSIEAPSISPTYLNIGVAGNVLITAKINSNARKKIVRLQQEKRFAIALNKRVKAWKKPLKMFDNATHGDAVAGDGLFSRLLPLQNKAIGWVRYRVLLNVGSKQWRTGISTIPVLAAGALILPDLSGMDQASAQQKLQDLGLMMGNKTESLRIFSAPGLVVAHDPLPDEIVQTGSSINLVITAAIPAKAQENLPANWAGRWKITTIYRDSVTDHIDHVSEVTSDLCASDPVGLALLEQVVNNTGIASEPQCTGQATTSGVQFGCSTQINATVCTFTVDSEMNLSLNIDQLKGSGQWRINETCGLPLNSAGQTLSLSGTRMGPPDSRACALPASSFLRKFVRNPLLRHFEVAL
jgi:hypothetical protein